MQGVEHPLGNKVQIDLPHGGAGVFFLAVHRLRRKGGIDAERYSLAMFLESRAGRLLQEKLQGHNPEHRIDFCIANVENAAAGFGITPQIADEFLNSEIDVLTSGNHIWDKRAIVPYLQNSRGCCARTIIPKGLREPAYISATRIAACASEC